LYLSRLSATGFKGVYKYNGRFTAKIYIGEGKEESLGQFQTPVLAALKYATVRNEREAVWKQQQQQQQQLLLQQQQAEQLTLTLTLALTLTLTLTLTP
jgi:hypothetical protein